MALSRADLGETEHVLTRNALRLLIRSHSQITLLHGSLDSCDLEEVVTGGLWITRGNGLNLAVRLNLGACAGPDFQLENFAEGLVDILSTAELWSQLSLKATRNTATPISTRLGHPVDLNFALSYSQHSSSSPQKNTSVLAKAANLHDTKPPAGVPVAFLNSIDLSLTVQLLPSPEASLKNRSLDHNRQTRNGDDTRYRPRPRRPGKYKPKENGYPLRCQPSVKDEDNPNGDILFHSPLQDTRIPDTEMPVDNVDEDILFTPPLPDTRIHDTETLEPNEQDTHMLLFPELECKPTVVTCFSTPEATPRAPPHAPPPLTSLDLLKLIDASVRHTISGPPPGSKKKPPPSDIIKLTSPSPYPSLAHISPALFRPAHMKVILFRSIPPNSTYRQHLPPPSSSSSSSPISSSQRKSILTHILSLPAQAIAARAPFITRIASSIAAISSSSSHTPPPPPSSSSPLFSQPNRTSSSTNSKLQTQLWHLLSKRRWPTTPLEPLDCDDIGGVFERCRRARVMMFDDEDDGLAGGRAEAGGVRVVGDEEMLDDDVPEMLEEDEEEETSLFTSLETTPFASQNLTDDAMMLLEDLEVGEEEELLLLGEDKSSMCYGREEGFYSLWQEPVNNNGAREFEDLDSQMLF